MSFKNKILASTLLLSGCAVPMVPGITPHKIEIQQGNIVTQEMLDKLEPGMTRNQVRYVLGTPLVIDPFRTDRWDYVYTMNRRGVALERRQLKVYFEGDRMARYEGDVLPETRPGEIATAGRPVAKTVEKVAEKPLVKPAAVAQVEKPVVKPAPVAPVAPVASAAPATPATPTLAAAEPALPRLPEPGTPVVSDAENKPNLRLAPSEGQAASAAEKIAVKPVPPKPAVPDGIEAPPLPRIAITPEEPAPGGAAVSPPATASAMSQPAPPAPARVVVAQPAPIVQPAPAPVVSAPPAVVATPAPVAVAKPAPAPAAKPVDKPAAKPPTPSGGWFSKLFGGTSASSSAPSRPRTYGGGPREAEPGSAPAPFYDSPEEQAAATGASR